MASFTIDSGAVHDILVHQLESWVAEMPAAAQDAPFVATAEGDRLSPLEILQHVQAGTDLGVQLMEHAAALAMSDFFTSK